MTEPTRIEAREDGPLVVKNARTIKNHDGADVEVKDVVALCRCGHSANKPFCDGSHSAADFTSANRGNAAGKDTLLSYQGDDVSVTYSPRLCSHAAECGRIASAAFDPKQKPWIQPDKVSRARIEEVVAACPSGALAIIGPDENRQHIVRDDRAQIEIEKNGPYWVTDVEPPQSPEATGASSRKYVLCRCGLSGAKPFCDGSHRDAKWRDGS